MIIMNKFNSLNKAMIAGLLVVAGITISRASTILVTVDQSDTKAREIQFGVGTPPEIPQMVMTTNLAPGESETRTFTPTKPGKLHAIVVFEISGGTRHHGQFSFNVRPTDVGLPVDWTMTNDHQSLENVTDFFFDTAPHNDNLLCATDRHISFDQQGGPQGETTTPFVGVTSSLALDSGTQVVDQRFHYCDPGSQIPEPTSAAFLALGTFALILRRRR